jgi:hypothetical protein
MHAKKYFASLAVSILSFLVSTAQKETVSIVKEKDENKIDVFVNPEQTTAPYLLGGALEPEVNGQQLTDVDRLDLESLAPEPPELLGRTAQRGLALFAPGRKLNEIV